MLLVIDNRLDFERKENRRPENVLCVLGVGCWVCACFREEWFGGWKEERKD